MTVTDPTAPDEGALFRFALFTQTPRAWVTPLLVGLNVAVFAAMVIAGVSILTPTTDSLIQWGANYAPRTTAGEWWRLITNTFIHVGAIHIGMNMIGLWQIGALVERLLGHRSFLLVYLFSGLCGSLASLTWHPFVVSAGASGAVFGVYGVLVAYLVRHRGSIPRTVLLQLQRSTAIFIGLNVVVGLQQKNIDMAAHIGGLVGGFAAALIVARPLITLAEASRRHAALSAQDPAVAAPPARTGTSTREAMVVAIAVLLIAAAVRLMPRAPDLQKELGDFQAVEQKVIDTFNSALEQRSAEQLSDDALAQIIEQQVLPPWNQYRLHLNSIGRLPQNEAKRFDRIALYMDLRERSWTALAQSLRTDDNTKANESKALRQQAESLMKGTGADDD